MSNAIHIGKESLSQFIIDCEKAVSKGLCLTVSEKKEYAIVILGGTLHVGGYLFHLVNRNGQRNGWDMFKVWTEQEAIRLKGHIDASIADITYKRNTSIEKKWHGFDHEEIKYFLKTHSKPSIKQ